VQETKPEFVRFERDFFWVTHTCQDPVKPLAQYPKRWALMHLKDMRRGWRATWLFVRIKDFATRECFRWSDGSLPGRSCRLRQLTSPTARVARLPLGRTTGRRWPDWWI
jgi:sugar phosphate isomerase/epimerase